METTTGFRLDEFVRATDIVAAAIVVTLPVCVAISWLLTRAADWTPTLSCATASVVT